jgi:hypothetical protein
MSNKNTRKRGLVAGGIAALLVAGVAGVGASITTDSTIFDNTFGLTTTPPATPGKIIAAGQPIVVTYDGVIDGESEYTYIDITNDHDTNPAQWNMDAKMQGANPMETAFFNALDAKVTDASGDELYTGKLNAINFAGQDIGADETQRIRVEVSINDAAAFDAANIAGGTVMKADFRVNGIYS